MVKSQLLTRVFNPLSPVKSRLLGMTCLFKHQDMQIFRHKLKTNMCSDTHLQVSENFYNLIQRFKGYTKTFSALILYNTFMKTNW